MNYLYICIQASFLSPECLNVDPPSQLCSRAPHFAIIKYKYIINEHRLLSFPLSQSFPTHIRQKDGRWFPTFPSIWR